MRLTLLEPRYANSLGCSHPSVVAHRTNEKGTFSQDEMQCASDAVVSFWEIMANLILGYPNQEKSAYSGTRSYNPEQTIKKCRH